MNTPRGLNRDAVERQEVRAEADRLEARTLDLFHSGTSAGASRTGESSVARGAPDSPRGTPPFPQREQERPEASKDQPQPGGTCGTCSHARGAVGGFMVCKELESWRSFTPSTPCPIGKWKQASEQAMAKREAQDGIERALRAADVKVSGWSDLAFKFVALYAQRNRGKQFIGHDLVQASIDQGIIQPPNAKAWGAPIQRAAREGIIRRAGFAPDPNRHTNPVPLWEACW